MINRSNNYILGILLLILAQTMVAVNVVFSKLLLSSMSVIVLLAVRFILATLILLPLHWLTPARKISLRQHFSQMEGRDWIYLLLQAICAGVLFNFLMLLGLNYTDANIAGIITSALPAMIAIMSLIFLKEKINGKKTLCVFFASIGLLIIAWNQFTAPAANNSALGNLLVFMALIPETAYYILCKRHPGKLPVFLTSSLINAVNASILIIALLIFQWDAVAFTPQTWLILVILGISSGLFYVFWLYGCQRVDGVMASLLTAVMPVATVIFAWLLLKEQLNAVEYAGMALVMLSIVVYAR